MLTLPFRLVHLSGTVEAQLLRSQPRTSTPACLLLQTVTRQWRNPAVAEPVTYTLLLLACCRWSKSQLLRNSSRTNSLVLIFHWDPASKEPYRTLHSCMSAVAADDEPLLLWYRSCTLHSCLSAVAADDKPLLLWYCSRSLHSCLSPVAGDNFSSILNINFDLHSCAVRISNDPNYIRRFFL